MRTKPIAQLRQFNHLASEIDAVYHQAALKLGLSDSAMVILYTICNSGDACLLCDVTRSAGISKQTVNSALRKLEAEGIVYLEAVNGRQKRVCLTGDGKRLVQKTVLRVIQAENEIFSAWTDAEQETYLALTQRYLSAFREKIQTL